MNSTKTRIALLAATTLMGVGAPAAAHAQQASELASADEIVVTARRREESVQSVPLAVSVLGASQLERAGVTDVMSLQGAVPNLVISPGQGAGAQTPVWAIRGLSQQDLTHLSDPSVSMYFNDVAVPRPIGGNVGFFDIANVQVARGPQGTLFGRNTTGGAVLVTPHAPEREFGASISQEISSNESYRTELVLNLPLGEAAALRIAGVHRESDGYIYDTVRNENINTIDEQGLRVTLDWDVSESVNTQFALNLATADNGGTGLVSAPPAPANSPSGRYITQSGHPQHNDVDVWQLDNHTTFEINDKLTIRNIIGYREMQNDSLEDMDAVGAIRGLIPRVTDNQSFSEELQILGDEDWGNWIAGLYYFHEEGDDLGASIGPFLGAPAASPNTTALENFRNYDRYSATWSTAKNTSYAIFAQATFKLASVDDGLSATIGLRQNWDEREAVILNRVVDRADPDGMICRFSRDLDNNTATPETAAGSLTEAQCRLSLSEEFEEPTFNFSLDWQATEDMLVYFATRHGYRTGGFGARANTEAGLRRTFEPETVNDYEIGIKADWHPGDMFLRTNLALFYADYSDIQRLLQDSTTSPVTTVTTNAGEAHIQGAEFEFTFRPTDWLQLSGFWAHTVAEFDEFLSPQTTPPTDISGNPFARAPENIGSLTVRVDKSLGQIGDGNFSISYFHQDKYSSNDTFSPLTSWQESYDLFDIVAGIDNVFGSNGNVQLFVKNAFDNEYSTSVLSVVSGPSVLINSHVPGAPRVWGVRLRYAFGGE